MIAVQKLNPNNLRHKIQVLKPIHGFIANTPVDVGRMR